MQGVFQPGMEPKEVNVQVIEKTHEWFVQNKPELNCKLEGDKILFDGPDNDDEYRNLLGFFGMVSIKIAQKLNYELDMS